MGITRDEITLTNAVDLADARRGLISEKSVRSVTVTAVADTGALRLTIPESLREKLEAALTEGVEVRWKDRLDITQAWVVQRECAVLLGAMPMEGMDIMIDPKGQRLVGIHGDEQLGILY
ncbi:MAG: hypothetical protein LBD55_08210 [Treponema sp.]|nr:hypothetical protein [Treponema sp.]